MREKSPQFLQVIPHALCRTFSSDPVLLPVPTTHSCPRSSDPTHFESPSPSRSGAVSDPRPPPHPDNGPADPNQLIKQTYSVICDPRSQNPTHWRLTTYFTLSSLPKLHTVRSGYISCLATLTFPSDQYKWFKAYKAELRHDVERAPDAIQVPRRGSFESQHDTSSPGRQNLPSLTTIAPPRHSPTPSSPSVSRTPSSPYSNYMTSPQHQSSSLSSSRSTPLLPLAELQNAHPRGQRSDLDQRQLAALSSSRPASVAPLSPGQTWATPFSYTSSYANQQYNSFASSAGHATQCSVCASLGTSMSMCSRCGNWIGQ